MGSRIGRRDDAGTNVMIDAATSSSDLTNDAFLDGRLRITQPKFGYRAGLDAVFLAAAACDPSQTCRVLDVGAGVGTVGLCVAARSVLAHVVLLEKEPQLADLATQNVVQNQLTDRVKVANADVKSTTETLAGLDLARESFDFVVANPPYHFVGKGTPAPNALKAASHAMDETSLDDWVRFMARMTKPSGTATMIHKAEALPALLGAFGTRFGGLRVLPIYARRGQPANRVIVQGSKGSRAPLMMMPGFILHEDGNEFTRAAQAILKDGASIGLSVERP